MRILPGKSTVVWDVLLPVQEVECLAGGRCPCGGMLLVQVTAGDPGANRR